MGFGVLSLAQPCIPVYVLGRHLGFRSRNGAVAQLYPSQLHVMRTQKKKKKERKEVAQCLPRSKCGPLSFIIDHDELERYSYKQELK